MNTIYVEKTASRTYGTGQNCIKKSLNLNFNFYEKELVFFIDNYSCSQRL